MNQSAGNNPQGLLWVGSGSCEKIDGLWAGAAPPSSRALARRLDGCHGGGHVPGGLPPLLLLLLRAHLLVGNNRARGRQHVAAGEMGGDQGGSTAA